MSNRKKEINGISYDYSKDEQQCYTIWSLIHCDFQNVYFPLRHMGTSAHFLVISKLLMCAC